MEATREKLLRSIHFNGKGDYHRIVNIEQENESTLKTPLNLVVSVNHRGLGVNEWENETFE